MYPTSFSAMADSVGFTAAIAVDLTFSARPLNIGDGNLNPHLKLDLHEPVAQATKPPLCTFTFFNCSLTGSYEQVHLAP